MHKTPATFVCSQGGDASFVPAALAFVFAGNKLLTRTSETEPPVALPCYADLEALSIGGAWHRFGVWNGVDCVAAAGNPITALPEGWAWQGLRALFSRVPDDLLSLAGRAYQIVEWDRTHRYCGVCASPTRNRADERAKECPACGHVMYPRIAPAMMVLITRGQELLLARAARFPTGMYSALAGFVEAGESIEECIHREVREEVCVEVTDLRYFESQSWPFPHSLMIAYTGEYASGDMHPGDAEIADARWFSIDALPALPNRLSIARRLIDAMVSRLRRDD